MKNFSYSYSILYDSFKTYILCYVCYPIFRADRDASLLCEAKTGVLLLPAYSFK